MAPNFIGSESPPVTSQVAPQADLKRYPPRIPDIVSYVLMYFFEIDYFKAKKCVFYKPSTKIIQQKLSENQCFSMEIIWSKK